MACALAVAALGCKKSNVDLGPLPEAKPAIVRAHDCQLRVTLTPEKTTFAIDEPVWMTFRATPECDAKLTLLSVGDIESKFGRSEGYRVSARATSGNHSVEEPQGGEVMGGGVGRLAFTRTEPFQARLRISHYLLITHAGRYELTVRKSLVVGKKGDADSEQSVVVDVSIFVDVTAS